MTSSSSTRVKSTITNSRRSFSASSTLSSGLPSLSGYSACVPNYLQLSIAYANCSSVADVNCLCPRCDRAFHLHYSPANKFHVQPNSRPDSETCHSPMPKRASYSGDPFPKLLHLSVYEHISGL
ncbi:hypothetical protein ARMGADRAFT_96531 [Armillaria gallica]|uniref:Uncharacterized protein n=1 Tax=Armillaria gallica TaxID=47427 RepID=A0A2H3CL71_ARMGA|nr:hypothetical protein ARMGADRAFT_96531 [Armillaria gallica]